MRDLGEEQSFPLQQQQGAINPSICSTCHSGACGSHSEPPQLEGDPEDNCHKDTYVTVAKIHKLVDKKIKEKEKKEKLKFQYCIHTAS